MNDGDCEEPKLSHKQLAFVREYVLDYNATQAAIRAGYSEKTACSQGNRLLRNVEVADAIAEEQDLLAERTRVSRERIAKELARAGFSDMRQFAEWGPDGARFKDSEELSADDSPAVQEVTTEHRVLTNKDGDIIGETTNAKIKLHDKLGALRMLGQHIGMFKDGATVNVGVNVNSGRSGDEERREQFASLHEQIQAYRQGHDDATHSEAGRREASESGTSSGPAQNSA